MYPQYTTWQEISRQRIRENIGQIRTVIGSTKVMAVVKGNAYGLGIEGVVNSTKDLVDWYGVISLREANTVRSFTNKPIIILGNIGDSELREAIRNNYRLLVHNFESLKRIKSFANHENKAIVHIKIDSGLTRLGLRVNDMGLLVTELKKCSNVSLEGICTHFSRLMDSDGRDIYKEQMFLFAKCQKKLENSGLCAKIKHVASSLPAVLYDDTKLNMVRIGIMMHGLWGRRDILKILEAKNKKVNLRPVLVWKTTVLEVKKVSPGTSIGYMDSKVVDRDTFVAVIGVGYYDGIDRRYARDGFVLINGKKASFLGKIAMNMSMVDVTNIPSVKVGDVAIIVGKSGKEEISCYDIADSLETSTYEVLARINPFIPKLLI